MIDMKLRMLMMACAFTAIGAWAQSAKSVLDKAASQLSRGAVSAHFSASGAMGKQSGTLVAQGNKFVLTSPKARIWFDGKTEWALAQGSGEVNVTTPSAGEVASMNPMNFVYLYKRGYNATVADKGTSYEVHLVATNAKNSIKEAYVMVAKSSNLPYQVRIRTGASSWTTISISELQVGAKKGDAFFRFNAKDFPKVDVVDLR